MTAFEYSFEIAQQWSAAHPKRPAAKEVWALVGEHSLKGRLTKSQQDRLLHLVLTNHMVYWKNKAPTYRRG